MVGELREGQSEHVSEDIETEWEVMESLIVRAGACSHSKPPSRSVLQITSAIVCVSPMTVTVSNQNKKGQSTVSAPSLVRVLLHPQGLKTQSPSR